MKRSGYTDLPLHYVPGAAQTIEERHDPSADFDRIIEKEMRVSRRNGGRTVFDKAEKAVDEQLALFLNGRKARF